MSSTPPPTPCPALGSADPDADAVADVDAVACSSLVVAGGVASNQYIRAQLNDLAASEGLSLVMPPPRWCTDNGVMIAWAGIER